jgi:hypothetical protein
VATGGCARSGHCCTMDRRGRIYRKNINPIMQTQVFTVWLPG